MPRLLYLRSVRRDLANLADGIAQASGSIEIARRFVGSIRARCATMAELPGVLGSAREDLGSELRSTPHRGYTILFRYQGARLEIVRVLSARRDATALFEEVD